MNTNVGTTDRIIRFGIAAVFVLLNLLSVTTGTLAIILWVAAVVMALTGTFKFCGLYAILGMSTCTR